MKGLGRILTSAAEAGVFATPDAFVYSRYGMDQPSESQKSLEKQRSTNKKKNDLDVAPSAKPTIITVKNAAEESYVSSSLSEEFKPYLQRMTLSADYPRLPLQNAWIQSQMRSLAAEINFLTQYGHLSNTVIYAGAAPGHHIPCLAKLFPHHKFILFDPSPFAPSLQPFQTVETVQTLEKELPNGSKNVSDSSETYSSSPSSSGSNIEVHNTFLDQKKMRTLCDEFGSQSVLFISDMRTVSPSFMTGAEALETQLLDNDLIVRWCQILRPCKALLTFALPSVGSSKNSKKSQNTENNESSSKTVFLDAECFLSPFGRFRTSLGAYGTCCELRVVPRDNENYEEMKVWDGEIINEQMGWFDEVARREFVRNPYFCESLGLTHDYDAWAYATILSRYLQSMAKSGNVDESDEKSEQRVQEEVQMEDVWQLHEIVMDAMGWEKDTLRRGRTGVLKSVAMASKEEQEQEETQGVKEMKERNGIDAIGAMGEVEIDFGEYHKYEQMLSQGLVPDTEPKLTAMGVNG